MNRKKLGGVAALSLAALTAVPTFSIVASADFSYSLTSVWQVPQYNTSTGEITGYKYYDTKAHADVDAKSQGVNGVITYEVDSGKTDDDGNPIMEEKKITVTSASVSPNYVLTINGKFDVDSTTGEITANSNGQYTWSGSSSGTTTPGTTEPPENPGTTTTPGGTIIVSSTYSSAYPWYSSVTKMFYKTKEDAVAHSGNESSVRLYTSSSSPSYSTTYSWYSTYTQRYYADYETALAASLNNPSYVIRGTYYGPEDYSNTGSLTYRYYSSITNRYYRTWNDAYVASNYDTTKVTEWTSASSSSVYSSTYPWYSSYTKRYYQTYAAALAASPNSSYVSQGSASSSSVYSSTYSWYSSYTKRYYQTYAAALAASNNNASYVSQGNYYYYNDPYYYYYYGLGGLGYNTTTTTTKDTSTVTIGTLKGWTSVVRTINSARSGAAYTVNMKTETEIPSTVLTALKGKNVSINFKFSNGAIFTLNGNDITSTSAISPVIKYGSTSIPSSLKKKAVSSNDGVSSSQFTINGGSFGADASVTVKFNTKRAGCSAKLYRYNASANTLSLVSRSAVQSNGQCKFDDVKQGGEYIVVLS